MSGLLTRAQADGSMCSKLTCNRGADLPRRSVGRRNNLDLGSAEGIHFAA
jgi:hypothetical protein